MPLSHSDLTRIALDITSGLPNSDRFSRLLATVRDNLHCDAAALLRFQGNRFIPLAIDGLRADVLGRSFNITEHPRLEAIARAGDLVRFPADSQLPDPYDGLIAAHTDKLKVHACIGLPLLDKEQLIGALTIDGLDPCQFDDFSDEELRSLSAIAAASLGNALLLDKLESLSLQSQSQPLPETGHSELLGESPQMLALKREIAVVAPSDLNVLILGETGTGKELVAKAVHAASPRGNKALVYLNCAALPESVAESELFGHVKGAFTGAISNRAGKFELADKGTLFLDEIGELSLPLQAKLLRVLQYGDLQRVGEDRSLTVDVRVIAATNKDLKTEVVEGRFRADLYHRLSVFPLLVPPLRERGRDILLLAGHFLERCRSKLGLERLSLSAESEAWLLANDWPGNVRELEHLLHRASVLARAASDHNQCQLQLGELQSKSPSPSALPRQLDTTVPAESITLKQATAEFQRQLLRSVLERHQYNWAASARELGVDPGNLHRLAKRLQLK
ncbi:nitric oxide reductase transcriptional regulator NorR [Shewanella algae]|uniref:nitric oxide reductase transcriptional regulator NorR n=1 Tax=Shewanella algae TaxID=38313 RepID=UPI001AAE0DFE|nr:nitric oxide reductase transcriptional regulator NorR [Shewanella algae]QTE85865.1 nitric oxide reductase transcriptional regulator NorR [Shewanella algae]